MIKTIKKFLNKRKTEKETFRWSDISSRNQKKIIKNAISGSNKLQRDLYKKAGLLR